MKLMCNKTYKPTQHNLSKTGAILFLIGVYGFLFYFVFTNQFKLDFSSLYSACQSIAEGENPYRVLLTTYLPTVKKLPANLNPPFVLWLFSPFVHINYKPALVIWSFLSFALGLVGAGIAFKYTFSAAFLKKNRVYLFLIYLAAYATIADTAIAQLGTLPLFFIMMGYHFSMTNCHKAAGIMWGFIIAIKLFPALLFFHAFAQKRYKICVSIFFTFLLLSLIPLFNYGMGIYSQYFSLMSKVVWYGDSWNASLYGFIFRVFVDLANKPNHLLSVYLLYGTSFSVSFIFYFKKIVSVENQSSFCLTLVMMLLLSPFGWLYYFPLLTFPLAITWLAVMNERKQPVAALLTWCLCLFFINFPMDYIPAYIMPSLLNKLSIYSFHFYGLLLLLYLSNKMTTPILNSPVAHQRNEFFVPVLCTILSFDLLIIIMSFLQRLF